MTGVQTCALPISWDRAWDVVTKTFAYTNHTVMSEALECWNEDMLRSLLPRIYQIIKEIDNRWCSQLEQQYHLPGYTVSKMAIIRDHIIHMANLSIVGTHSINGVSQLHSDILRDDLFNYFYKVSPEKFNNVTNGIASRRWLYQANPRLTGLITQLIGDGFLHDMPQLKKLLPFQEDKQDRKSVV